MVVSNMSNIAIDDSKIPWLGVIPKTWSLTTISAFYELRNEKVSDKDYPPLSVTMNGIVPRLDSAAKTDNGDNRKLVRKGDFAINSRSDRRGSCGISEYDGSVSLINTVLKPKGKMHPGYYNWLFHTVPFADEFYKWGHGIVEDLWTTRWQEMKRIVIPVPPFSEQSAIAVYLDSQCAKIDSIIAEAKDSIEEYKAWKTSLIFEAVSKGLCSNVETKNSGIDWIGDIPSTWEVHTLYQLVSQVKNKNSNMQEENLLSLSYGKIKRRDINARGGLLPESFNGYNIIQQGDIVLRLTDLQNDHTSLRVGLASEQGIITSAYTVLRPINSEVSPYLYYLLHAFDTKKGFYGMGSGVRQGLNYSEVKDLRVVLPPISEQILITNYLSKKTENIDAMISDKESIINDLTDYKKSLIYEVVTGKRKSEYTATKDSGIEWIGKIPASWTLCKQKYVIRLINGRAYKDTEFEENGKYKVLRVGNLFTNSKWYTSSLELDPEKYCDAGDLLYAWSASYGPCIWQGEKVIYHYHIWKTELSQKLDKMFAYYYFIALSRSIASEFHGSAMAHVTMGNMNNSYIAYPDIKQQMEIADYLNMKCAAIDKLISEKESILADLFDYKKSLIYEVVTGKRKVV